MNILLPTILRGDKSTKSKVPTASPPVTAQHGATTAQEKQGKTSNGENRVTFSVMQQITGEETNDYYGHKGSENSCTI